MYASAIKSLNRLAILPVIFPISFAYYSFANKKSLCDFPWLCVARIPVVLPALCVFPCSADTCTHLGSSGGSPLEQMELEREMPGHQKAPLASACKVNF